MATKRNGYETVQFMKNALFPEIALPIGFWHEFSSLLQPLNLNQNQIMKALKIIPSLALAGTLFLAIPAFAGPQAKTYQVTGPVLELTDNTIVVQKGEEKWQVARDAGTKVAGDLKVGAKVTIQYRCVATDVEVKGEKAANPANAEKPKKPASK